MAKVIQLEFNHKQKIDTGATGTPAYSSIFQLPPSSGLYWGQASFQAVETAISALIADLQQSLDGGTTWKTIVGGLDLHNLDPLVNLSGGNAQYRFHYTTFTGTSIDLWGIAA